MPRDPETYHKDQTLDWDKIPLERHWGISILLHNALGHKEPWEICEEGCDKLAAQCICELFDHPFSNEDS